MTTRQSDLINQIVAMDIGARSGIQSFWVSCPYPVQVIGFEPDEEECRLLNKQLQSSELSGKSVRRAYYPIALGRTREVRNLYLYKDRRLSSFFLPNRNLCSHFPLDRLLLPDAFSIDAEIAIDCIPLDEFCRIEKIKDVDFIKLDTQGSELEILQGGKETLTRVFAVAVEVEFVPLYDGQPLFADVDAFLRDQGFSLFDLNRHWWKRAVPSTVDSRGQMIFADALYLRDVWNREQSNFFWQSLQQEPEKLEKTIVMSSLLGYSDYALDLLNYHLKNQYIDEYRYETWRIQYIHYRKQWKNIQPPLLDGQFCKFNPYHLFRERFARLAGQWYARLLNTHYYDNDESKKYR